MAIASLAPDVFCVSMNGLSKSHRIAGFRVGWMVLSGPNGMSRAISRASICCPICAFAPMSWPNRWSKPLLVASNRSIKLLLPGGRIYEQRNFIHKAINDIPGLSAVKPQAGLYIFPKIDQEMYRIDDDEEFCLRLLKQEKVMLVPGKGFNWNQPDHFRIVYLPTVEELGDVQEKITRVLNQYKC